MLDVVWLFDYKVVLVNFMICDGGCMELELELEMLCFEFGGIFVVVGGVVVVLGMGFVFGFELCVEFCFMFVLFGMVIVDGMGSFCVMMIVFVDIVFGVYSLVVVDLDGVEILMLFMVIVVVGGGDLGVGGFGDGVGGSVLGVGGVVVFVLGSGFDMGVVSLFVVIGVDSFFFFLGVVFLFGIGFGFVVLWWRCCFG